MDKNTWIGFGLIAAIFIGFSLLNRPSQAEVEARQRRNDSIALVQQQMAEQQKLIAATMGNDSSVADLVSTVAPRESKEFVLENSRLRLYIAERGGRIVRAYLKEYKAYGDTINDLCLFRANEQSVGFTLVTANNHILNTENLYFDMVASTDTSLTMRLATEMEDAWLDFVFTLRADDYMVAWDIVPHNMQNVLAQNMNSLEMTWNQRIPQQEKGRTFEERYARLQYMLMGGDREELSESKHDTQKESARVRWFAFKDQFFSTVLISGDGFTSTQLESTPMDKYSGYIKEYNAKTSLAFDASGRQPVALQMYLGPNHYNTLKSYDKGKSGAEKLNLKSLVPLGWKIVAWINMYLVIPMFDLFTSWGMHIGWVILLMTLVIKIIILPFVFKSYESSAKMRVLRPQVEEINAKYPPEKMQERQQATMELYHRAGASPMSGCLPMLFQFPVVMAMFWFFPTAIELRGKSFLWADDLSTYDDIINWGVNLPFIGDHLSLFCILFTLVNIVYTYVNMQNQGGGDPSMKMMQWMMYLMPLVFFFIFNDYAAGLSYYYLLSLFFSILQTMIFRWTLDDAKLLRQMEKHAKKNASKPKSGFMARLEQMQREQQRLAREQAKRGMK